LKRSCIGIEINPEYIEITKKRLNWGSSLSDNIEWEFKDMVDLR
jgi:DNA modification methylase